MARHEPRKLGEFYHFLVRAEFYDNHIAFIVHFSSGVLVHSASLSANSQHTYYNSNECMEPGQWLSYNKIFSFQGFIIQPFIHGSHAHRRTYKTHKTSFHKNISKTCNLNGIDTWNSLFNFHINCTGILCDTFCFSRIYQCNSFKWPDRFCVWYLNYEGFTLSDLNHSPH